MAVSSCSLFVLLLQITSVLLNRIDFLNRHADRLVLSGEHLEQYKNEPFSQNFATKRSNGIVVYENKLPVAQYIFVDNTTVYARLHTNSVVKSEDAMLTWKTLSFTLGDNDVTNVAVSLVDPRLVWITGSKNTFWVSEDAGKTFRTLSNTLGLVQFNLNPSQRTSVIAYYSTTKSIYKSADLGNNWSMVYSNVYQFSWCYGGTTICAIADIDANAPNGGGLKRFATFNPNTNEIVQVIPTTASDFFVHPKFVFVSAEDMSGGMALYISNTSNTFKQALFPKGVEEVPAFGPEQFLDDRTGNIWVAINPSPFPARSGNVYTSDAASHRFSLALSNVHQLSNWWDFDFVRSLEGVYLANVIDSTTSFSVRTVITFDNGNEWKDIPPPDSFNCAAAGLTPDKCRLNLFGITTWIGAGGGGFYGNFYSAPQAVGIVLATGNAGEYLKPEPENVVTYMTRDGGISWVELMKGSTVYEFLDHGGVLLLVRNQVPTTTLYYSLDEGLSWVSYNFTTTPIVVVNVFTTSPSLSQGVIFGYVYSTKQVIYYGLDFSQIQERACTAEDYETWSFSDGARGGKCVLGHQTVYSRRKRASPCYSTADLGHYVSQTNCDCTPDDYECDWNYERTELSRKCVKVENDAPVVCSPDGTYMKSQGYRKVPEDTCVNDLVDYAPIKMSCGTSNTDVHPVYGDSSALSPAIIVLIVLGVLFGVAGLVIFGIVLGRSQFLRRLFNRRHEAEYSTQLPMDDSELD